MTFKDKYKQMMGAVEPDSELLEAAKAGKRRKAAPLGRRMIPVTASILAAVLTAGMLLFTGSSHTGAGITATAEAGVLAKAEPPAAASGTVSGAYIDSVRRLGVCVLPDLMGQNPGQNLMFSPLSLSLCATMLMDGAAGNTYTQLKQALGYGGMSDSDILSNSRAAYEAGALNQFVKLNIANAVWYNKGFAINQSYLDSCTQHFYADLYQQDFSDPKTVNSINKWCRDKTGGGIPQIIDRLDKNDVMALINAVNFGGKWQKAFPVGNTKPQSFQKADGAAVTCGFMSANDFNYKGTDAFQAVVLPYTADEMSMVLALPAAGKTPADLLADPATIKQILNYNGWTYQEDYSSYESAMNSEPQAANVTMPKFKFSGGADLTETMKSLGVTDAFGGAADFSKMDGKRDLYLSDIAQKTYIEVNETEANACAVTWELYSLTSAPLNPVDLTFNRPFIFAIVDKQGMPYFMGVVNDPTQS